MIETVQMLDTEPVIELPNIEAQIFSKVADWCRFHADDPAIVINGKNDDDSDDSDTEETEENSDEANKDEVMDVIPGWDLAFLQTDQSESGKFMNLVKSC